VAEAHARGVKRTCGGGSVVIRAFAPAQAIICDVAVHVGDGFRIEEEVLVDRRHLRRVDVVARYSQLTHEELRAIVEHEDQQALVNGGPGQ